MSITDQGLLAFGIGCLATVGFLFGGHYYWQPPRPRLEPPRTYVYGVLSCLIAPLVYCAWTGAWAVPLPMVLSAFAIGGFAVFVFYHEDERLTDKHEIADLRAARDEDGAQ